MMHCRTQNHRIPTGHLLHAGGAFSPRGLLVRPRIRTSAVHPEPLGPVPHRPARLARCCRGSWIRSSSGRALARDPEEDGRSRYPHRPPTIAALVGFFVVALQVVVGMFTEFGRSPFAHCPRWLLTNASSSLECPLSRLRAPGWPFSGSVAGLASHSLSLAPASGSPRSSSESISSHRTVSRPRRVLGWSVHPGGRARPACRLLRTLRGPPGCAPHYGSDDALHLLEPVSPRH